MTSALRDENNVLTVWLTANLTDELTVRNNSTSQAQIDQPLLEREALDA